MKTKESKMIDNLQTVLASLKNKTEFKKFLRDLLTEQELLELARRWQAAQMLAVKIPYTEIIKETGLSSTTVARVAKWLNKGMKGYKLALTKSNTNHYYRPSSSRKG
jgi:TrpR-related protein YerC/YecD